MVIFFVGLNSQCLVSVNSFRIYKKVINTLLKKGQCVILLETVMQISNTN